MSIIKPATIIRRLPSQQKYAVPALKNLKNPEELR